jgi:asparagine synthase (glutamine-hydrolysing)
MLLTGQMGNSGISWTGDVFSQPLPAQLRQVGVHRWAKRAVKNLLPKAVVSFIRRRRQAPDWTRSAIAPDFAQRLRLFQRRLDDPWEVSPLSPHRQRMKFLRPANLVGCVQAELGAACGILATDPTADHRVLSFCLSVPDHIFIDPGTGTDRWLIREAMKGRLPDQVRLNRRRGRQSGDLVPRLRACAGEVDAALDEIAAGPAAAYLDLSHVRQVWDRIKIEDSNEVHLPAVAVLTRGIMAGLFVNGLGKTW